MTVFLARFDPVSLTLTYVNAGHNPPAVHHKGNTEITWLGPTAPAIGLVEEFHPRTESIVFSKGDSLLLYTDGVTEVLDTGNHEFGQERLADVLRQNADLTAPNMLQVLRQGMGAFGDNRPLVDDVTMIALKISE